MHSLGQDKIPIDRCYWSRIRAYRRISWQSNTRGSSWL